MLITDHCMTYCNESWGKEENRHNRDYEKVSVQDSTLLGLDERTLYFDYGLYIEDLVFVSNHSLLVFRCFNELTPFWRPLTSFFVLSSFANIRVDASCCRFLTIFQLQSTISSVSWASGHEYRDHSVVTMGSSFGRDNVSRLRVASCTVSEKTSQIYKTLKYKTGASALKD